MTPAVRRIAATAASVVASTVLLVPLVAVPASAAAPTQKAFVVADTNNNGGYGLYLQSTAFTGAIGTPIVAESDSTDVHGLSVSADGSRAAFVVDTYNPSTFAPLRHKVVVADVSGRIVRVLEDTAEDGVHYPSVPTLSPDGTVAVWEVGDASNNSVSIRKANVGSGAATTLAVALTPYAFLDSTTLLVQDIAGNPFTMPLAGGAKTAVTGLPAQAINVAVSPDGTHLAWGLFDDTVPTGSPYLASMQVAPVSVTGGVATVGSATTIATGLYNKQPSFSRDGSTVYFVRNDGKANTAQGFNGPGDIWSASATATDTSTAAVTSATSADELDVAIATADDGTVPGDPTSTPASLSGTSATVRWTEPADTDLSGVLVSRNGGAARYVPAPVTSLVDTGLVPGTTYSYTFTSVDRSGNLGTTPAVRQLTALAPGATFADPTSIIATKAPFAVKFATAAPTNVTFLVDYLVAGTTTWKRWVTNTAGLTRTFGSAATTGVAATTSVPGANYTFRVTATDAFGNSTATVLSAHAIVPFDQTKATLSGGSTLTSGAYYLGTVRRLTTTASYAKVSLYGNRFQIIGFKCAACGKFVVYDGSTKVATVDTYATSTKLRQVLYTRLTTLGNHTYTIRPLATAGRPSVVLDGFAMRR
ncbi:MAG: putative N-acetylmuramoyl-L-alanine amidase [Frankiales bacterium]|nr:putative N-acetylmuramoyl-L-alanine amidase [Frankiales bacterium]